jgi:hypothetical protein
MMTKFTLLGVVANLRTSQVVRFAPHPDMEGFMKMGVRSLPDLVRKAETPVRRTKL